MHYKVTKYVGDDSQDWQCIEGQNIVELKNNLEKIQIKIVEENAYIEIIGNGCVIVFRENKTAKLVDKAVGKIRNGDKIWILNNVAEKEYQEGKRNDFFGAAILIELINKASTQEIFVNERKFSNEKNNNKINLILGLSMFTILVGGTVLGYQKKTQEEQRIKFAELKSSVENKILEIKSVRTVNIDTALELANGAESIISSASGLEKTYGPELTKLKQEIGDIKKGLGGESIDFEVAYDTSLILEGNNQFIGMGVKDNVTFLWNTTVGQINMVDPKLKSTEKIVGDEKIKNWIGIFNNGERWYGYDQNKIYEIKRNELVETEIKNLQNIKEMTGWGGQIYVIDNDNRNISKLTEGDSRFWLKEGNNLSEEMSSITIDSNIWMLGKSGKIYKYTRGVQENFEMSFLSNSNNVRKLRTNDKVEFLAYIIDDNTVVIYGKDGKILGKYNFSKTKINDIGIESQDNAVLVLAENGKIYRIKIK